MVIDWWKRHKRRQWDYSHGKVKLLANLPCQDRNNYTFHINFGTTTFKKWYLFYTIRFLATRNSEILCWHIVQSNSKVTLSNFRICQILKRLLYFYLILKTITIAQRLTTLGSLERYILYFFYPPTLYRKQLHNWYLLYIFNPERYLISENIYLLYIFRVFVKIHYFVCFFQKQIFTIYFLKYLSLCGKWLNYLSLVRESN